MAKNDDELIGSAEAAEMLHMDIRTVHRKIATGEIPLAGKLPGLRGSYILRRADVEALRTEKVGV